MEAPAMSQPATITAGLGAIDNTSIAAMASPEPTESTKRPPLRSMRRPANGARVPETSSAAVKAPKRKSSLMPSSLRIAGPSTPMA